ncbi:MAG: DUF1592 domain-containing protein [Planctomycetes bacterium]|nr:DUF1592 domain-containing protein [Planctomycetota bacterium]
MNCKMKLTHAFVPLVVLICGLRGDVIAAEKGATTVHLDAVTSAFEKYCLDCHSSSDAKAGLNLEAFDTSVALVGKPWDTASWEKIVKRLRARQMPPADVARPMEAEYERILATMESALDKNAEQFPKPGRTDPIRRLNRTEYRNAIRDLLAVDIDVEDLLPADELSHGFDNVTVSELSPVLLNRYITAAEQISRLAVGRQQRSPGGVTVRLPADLTQESHVEGLPLGTRGGTLIKHQFPVTGEYEIQFRLMRDRDENVEGLKGKHDIDVLVDRSLVHRFTVKAPKSGEGYQKDDTLVDANLKKRFRVTAGPHRVGVTFPQTSSSLSEIKRQPFEASFNRHRHPRRNPALFEVSIVGPFDPEGPGDTPSRRQIFTTRPSDQNEPSVAAEKIFRRLIRFAYRRPVTDSDLTVPMQFFGQRLRSDGFEAGIESGLTAVLVNPHFLFRAESTPPDVPPGTVYRISDTELASRLSFFLWSSVPDDELLALAEADQLHVPEVLQVQVDRMLRDPRSQSLVSNFAAQWLYLRNLDSFRPDRRLFPDFDDNLRKALRRETELLFEHVLCEDRSVLELIRSNITFVNERLAKHYGIPGVYGSHFRSVNTLGLDIRRGGILRQGSILAITSYATRTSPTIRGNWILENILGAPPPPPPPNVPALRERTTSSNVTVRERLAEHRENPACASCHDLMDPIGFALENFDAVGRWRQFDQGSPIDSSGALPDGKQLSGLDDLEAGIMERPEMFVSTLAEKLLIFALGRGVESYDAPAIRRIVRDSADKEYSFSSLINGIASSSPFQMKVAE